MANEYRSSCKGCQISQRKESVEGNLIIDLHGNWILNHDGGEKSFLGCLALQPRFHRMAIPELNQAECESLGPNIHQIDLSHLEP